MGHLHSFHNFENQSIGGVVLGAPMVVYHWDDSRIPSGEILADGTVVPDSPPVVSAVDTPSAAFTPESVVAVAPDEPFAVLDPIAVLDEVSALPEALPLQVVLAEIADTTVVADEESAP